MKKSKFFEPYFRKKTAEGTVYKCSMKNIEQSGVYLIMRKETKEIVYVGSAGSNLYKTIYRHFQEWKDTSRENPNRKVYPKFGYYVRIVFLPETKARIVEKFLILKYKPKDCNFKYESFAKEKEYKQAEKIVNTSTDWLEPSDFLINETNLKPF